MIKTYNITTGSSYISTYNAMNNIKTKIEEDFADTITDVTLYSSDTYGSNVGLISCKINGKTVSKFRLMGQDPTSSIIHWNYNLSLTVSDEINHECIIATSEESLSNNSGWYQSIGFAIFENNKLYTTYSVGNSTSMFQLYGITLTSASMYYPHTVYDNIKLLPFIYVNDSNTNLKTMTVYTPPLYLATNVAPPARTKYQTSDGTVYYSVGAGLFIKLQ